jgi:hypothetical protein
VTGQRAGPRCGLVSQTTEGLPPRISGTLTVDCSTKELDMIALGLILLIIGLVAGIGVLTTIGVILLVIGLILNLVPIGGSTRRVW